ncbi:unnamed protein product [Caenorhabditis auriculariae]|uniref:T-box domain-containing protein n=1 Tax=Caenorhabditis auriculariae TaxID=2777116 RepID=A0A8S1HPJ5_9PELO|nr:unnamed protein product [Caenorhabditis auriculariae]
MRISLAKEDLWRQFNEFTNEMIITKNGRNLFPCLEFKVEDLSPFEFYTFTLQIDRIDSNRHKFQGGEWSSNGPGEPCGPSRVVWHPSGVKSGADWMKRDVCFDRIKLTNNVGVTDPNHIVLHSMHKYAPTLSVYQYSTCDPNFEGLATPVFQRTFGSAAFVAVTAYQNNNVKNLKVEKNKYARGFRNERKRSSSSPETPENSAKMMPQNPEEALQMQQPWCTFPYPPSVIPGYNYPYYGYGC